MLGLFFDMLFMGICTTRHWQTSGRLVQELNVCTVHLSYDVSRLNHCWIKICHIYRYTVELVNLPCPKFADLAFLSQGGGTQVQKGAAPSLRISRKKGCFFKTSACPRFCKRRVLFCTQVRSMGVKIPLQSTKYTRL